MNLSLLSMLLAGGLSMAAPSVAAPLAPPPASLTAARSHPDDHPKVGGFSADTFVFKTVVADDGKDIAAGWQAAVATLRFVDARSLLPKTWTCRMRFDVPIRTSERGPVSTAEAATITAEVATTASITVMHSMDSWPVAALYCIKFQAELLAVYSNKYRWLGARVTRLWHTPSTS